MLRRFYLLLLLSLKPWHCMLRSTNGNKGFLLHVGISTSFQIRRRTIYSSIRYFRSRTVLFSIPKKDILKAASKAAHSSSSHKQTYHPGNKQNWHDIVNEGRQALRHLFTTSSAYEKCAVNHYTKAEEEERDTGIPQISFEPANLAKQSVDVGKERNESPHIGGHLI